MKLLDLTARIMLGLPFILFGASKFHAFMPTPPMTPEAARFIGALVQTGYLWEVVGLFEIAGALLLLWQRTVLHGLALLLPIIINIIAYLLILQQGVGVAPFVMSGFLAGMSAFLLGQRRSHWLPLWRGIPGNI
ncbi:MAG: DoxX family protein [Spirochaetales bacterium]|nr:DoxX family protein [Spirochaetales bacterium]